MSADISPVNPLEVKFLITFTFYNKLIRRFFKVRLKFIKLKLTRI